MSAWPAIAFLLVVEVITRGGRVRSAPVTVAVTSAPSPVEVTAPLAVPAPTRTPPAPPTRTRTAVTRKPRTGTPGKGHTAKPAGTRTDAELLAALADVPRDPDGTVPVRRAKGALGTGPDRARRLLADAGLLRTGADTPTVNGHPVPDLVTTSGSQS
jgi:hypothetical protein